MVLLAHLNDRHEADDPASQLKGWRHQRSDEAAAV
jgi:hypothetical protein